MNRVGGISLLIALLSALAAPSAMARQPAGEGKVDALVRRGDDLFHGRADKPTTWEAIGFYREALKVAPRSYGAHWRVARAFARLADWERERTGGSGTLGRKGHYHAVQAIAAAPRKVEGWYWAAICLGEHGSSISVVKALTSGFRGKFLAYLRRARKLDATYDDGGAARLSAMYHHKLPGPLQDNEVGLKEIKRSWDHSPGHSRTLYCWAQILWDEGHRAAAIKTLKRCTRANRGGTRVINRDFQSRCRRLLKEYGG